MTRTLISALAAATIGVAIPAAVQTTNDTLSAVSGTSGARGAQLLAFGPIGQSFTSIDSTLTSFGFQFQLFNAGSANTPISFSLRSGAGLNGASIYSTTLTLPETLPARTGSFLDFTVPQLAVAIGGVYTAVLSSSTDRIGVALGPEYNIYTGVPLGGDAYAGGRAYFTKAAFPNCTDDAASNCDLNFRVSGTRTLAAAVPEPAIWVMLILGIGAIGGVARRQGITRRHSHLARSSSGPAGSRAVD